MFACVEISPSFKLLCFTILKETGLLVYSSTCLLVYLSTYINKKFFFFTLPPSHSG